MNHLNGPARKLFRAQTMRMQMRFLKLAALAVAATLGLAGAGPAAAADEIPTLRLAVPQPDPAELKPGLAVKYSYPGGVRTLNEAYTFAANAQPGPPLVGFDYPNTMPGEKALTSEKVTMVVAKIDGYVKFDEAGTYGLEFLSNDGLQVALGGTRIYRYDDRKPCAGDGSFKVEVPQAGYYELSALFFQRYNTSCLLMKIKKPSSGGMVWASNDLFFYKP